MIGGQTVKINFDDSSFAFVWTKYLSDIKFMKYLSSFFKSVVVFGPTNLSSVQRFSDLLYKCVCVCVCVCVCDCVSVSLCLCVCV